MSNLFIPHPEIYKEKLKRIKDAGISKLHIVSDFDRTLTGETKDGANPTTSWAIFKSELGPEYISAREALFNHYYPIERDNTLDPEFRSEQMSIWWKKHLDLLVKYGVDVPMIQRALANEDLKLRGGVDTLFHFASKHHIPFLIFSAGIGDAIHMYLEVKELKTENVHILSNFFTFDKQGHAIGFEKEVVHAFNKTEVQVKTQSYLSQITERSNCILLGDSIYDATMTDGLPHEVVLKIGFLNGNEENRKEFEEVYDVIIEKDTNIEDINTLLKELL